MGELHPLLRELIDRHGDPLELVDQVPRSVTELYRRWTGNDDLRHRQRNERRRLANYLTYAAKAGQIEKLEILEDGQPVVVFQAASRSSSTT